MLLDGFWLCIPQLFSNQVFSIWVDLLYPLCLLVWYHGVAFYMLFDSYVLYWLICPRLANKGLENRNYYNSTCNAVALARFRILSKSRWIAFSTFGFFIRTGSGRGNRAEWNGLQWPCLGMSETWSGKVEIFPSISIASLHFTTRDYPRGWALDNVLRKLMLIFLANIDSTYLSA